MEKGFIHVYTGNGKGKTTAAFGLALRAACAGKKVYIGQFVKGMKYSEVEIEKYIPNIEIHQLGRSCFIDREPTDEDIELAGEGLKQCSEALCSGENDLVILDELNIALYFNLFSLNEVLDMISKRKQHVEVVITGRYAPQELIDLADLVTEMKEIKHYYHNGIMARKGIES